MFGARWNLIWLAICCSIFAVLAAVSHDTSHDTLWHSADSTVAVNLDSVVDNCLHSDSNRTRSWIAAYGRFEEYSVSLPIDRDNDRELTFDDYALIKSIERAYNERADSSMVRYWRCWYESDSTVRGARYYVVKK